MTEPHTEKLLISCTVIYLVVPFNKCGLCSQNASFILTCNTVNVRCFLVELECCDWSVSVEFSPTSYTAPDILWHVSLSVYKMISFMWTIIIYSWSIQLERFSLVVMVTLVPVVVVVVVEEIFIHGAVKATVTNRPQYPLNKWLFSSFLNWPTVVSDWRSEADRLFQSLGPATWKTRSPKPVWVRGTTQVETSDERSRWRPTSEAMRHVPNPLPGFIISQPVIGQRLFSDKNGWNDLEGCSRSLVMAQFSGPYIRFLLVVCSNRVSVLYHVLCINTYLAYLTVCDVEQSFSSIMTLQKY